MRFLFIRVEKANYPLTVLCRVLKVSRSGYYAFEKRGPSKRESADRELTQGKRIITSSLSLPPDAKKAAQAVRGHCDHVTMLLTHSDIPLCLARIRKVGT